MASGGVERPNATISKPVLVDERQSKKKKRKRKTSTKKESGGDEGLEKVETRAGQCVKG